MMLLRNIMHFIKTIQSCCLEGKGYNEDTGCPRAECVPEKDPVASPAAPPILLRFLWLSVVKAALDV